MMTTADRFSPQTDADGQPVRPPPGKLSRWQVSQDELVHFVRSLPEDATCAVVLFGDRATPFDGGRMLMPTPDNRERLLASIRPLRAEGLSNLYAALAAAFAICSGGPMDGLRPFGPGATSGTAPPADTIVLLSDGVPTAGQAIRGVAPTNPPNQRYSPWLVHEVCRWNETRGIAIHTAWIGPDGDGPFLRELAFRNRGTFRRITR